MTAATITLLILCVNPRIISSLAPIVCDYGGGKCAGNLIFQSIGRKVDSTVLPIAAFNVTTLEDCTDSCTLETLCWFADLYQGPAFTRCRLFGKNVHLIDADNDYSTYSWTCCSTADCRHQPYRCKGMWLRNFRSTILGARVLETFHNFLEQSSCLQKCIDLPLCAYVNIFMDEKKCDLLMFDAKKSYVKEGPNTSVYVWSCCADTDADLPKQCQPATDRCNGYWTGTSKKLKVGFGIGHFFTMDKFACMDACSSEGLCHNVIFNETSATCYLYARQKEHNAGKVFDASTRKLDRGVRGYEWNCCSPFVQPLPSMSDPASRAECLCLNSSRDGASVLAADGCSKPLLKHNMTLFSDTAAFWDVESATVKIHDKRWTRIIDGQRHLWISAPTNGLQRCTTDHCHLYSTLVNPEHQPNIINRSEWFARPPKRPLQKFVATPNTVVITNTVDYCYGCYTKTMCSRLVLDLQKVTMETTPDIDIAFNFLIGQDGNVYEGRGSDHVGAHTLGRDYDSIGIAFIGWYKVIQPTVRSLIAARTLLKKLVRDRKLTHNYILYGYRDVRSGHAPGKYLYRLLKNWENYFTNADMEGRDCEKILQEQFVFYTISGFSIFAVIALTASAVMLYKNFFSHEAWCPRRLVKATVGSTSRSPITRCSFQTSTDEAGRAGDWPPRSIRRQAESLQINTRNTTLMIIKSRDLTCRCAHLYSVLWSRCVTDSLSEFPAFLKVVIKQSVCRAQTVLQLDKMVMLFHAKDIPSIQAIMKMLADNRCICNEGFVAHVSEVPVLDNVQTFSGDSVTFDASRILNQRLHRFETLDTYCRVFELENRSVVERSYREAREQVSRSVHTCQNDDDTTRLIRT